MFLSNINLHLEEDIVENIEENDSVDDSAIEFTPDTEELDTSTNDLTVASEAFSVLCNSYGGSEQYLRDSLMYACGRLGVNYNTLQQDVKTESFSLNTEGMIKNFASKILEVIRNVWITIRNFFKNIWVRIQAAYFRLTKNIFNVRKMVLGLRNKSDIVVSKEQASAYLKTFAPYAQFEPDAFSKNVNYAMVSLTGCCKDYLSRVEVSFRLSLIESCSKIIDAYNKDKSYDIFSTKWNNIITQFTKQTKIKFSENGVDNAAYVVKLNGGSITLSGAVSDDENGKVSSVENGAKRKEAIMQSIDKLIESEETPKISYTSLLNLAEAVDDIKYGIKDINKSVLSLGNSADKTIAKHGKGDVSKNDKAVLEMMLFISRCSMEYTKCIIEHVKHISKVIKGIYKEAKKTTVLGVKAWFADVQAGKINNIEVAPNTIIDIENPGEWKLVENKGMCYIDPGKTFWKTAGEKHQVIGGVACVSLIPEGLHEQGVTGFETITSARKTSTGLAAEQGYNDSLRVGLILLDEDGLKDPQNPVYPLFNMTGKIDFVYYHELGHLLTGQHETPMDRWDILNGRSGFEMYAVSRKEGRADAFACLKCGINPKKVVETRFELQSQLYKNVIGTQDNEGNLITEQIVNDTIANEEKYKEKMLENIQKEMSYMREYVDLNPYQYLKSKYISAKRK